MDFLFDGLFITLDFSKSGIVLHAYMMKSRYDGLSL